MTTRLFFLGGIFGDISGDVSGDIERATGEEGAALAAPSSVVRFNSQVGRSGSRIASSLCE